MNKSELASAAAKRVGVTAKAAREVLTAAFDEIGNALEKGQEVSVAGFGIFSTAERAPRNARNIQTGEIIRIGPKRVIRFKAGKRLKKRVAENAEK